MKMALLQNRHSQNLLCGSCDHEKNMSQYIYDKKCMNWVKGVRVLTIVKDGMFDFIKSKMKKMENDLLVIVKHDSSHFEIFLTDLIGDGHSSHFGTIKEPRPGCKIKLPCEACTEMVNLLRDNMDDKYKMKKWKCHDLSISPEIYWWILCKIYIPSEIKYSCGPNDVDAQAVFKLMALCKLFADVKWTVSTLIDWRNKLMHSYDNKLSTNDLNGIFGDANTLLEHTDVKSTLSSENARTEIGKLQSEQFVRISLVMERHMMIKEALTIKKLCIEDDIKANRYLNIEVDELEKLLRQTATYITEEEKRIQNAARNLRDDIESLRKRAEEAEENAERERQRAESERQRAESERQRADREEMRADREESRAINCETGLGKQKKSVLTSVATGAATGGTTGMVGGPIGAVVGATFGAVAGGISALWKK